MWIQAVEYNIFPDSSKDVIVNLYTSSKTVTSPPNICEGMGLNTKKESEREGVEADRVRPSLLGFATRPRNRNRSFMVIWFIIISGVTMFTEG